MNIAGMENVMRLGHKLLPGGHQCELMETHNSMKWQWIPACCFFPHHSSMLIVVFAWLNLIIFQSSGSHSELKRPQGPLVQVT